MSKATKTTPTTPSVPPTGDTPNAPTNPERAARIIGMMRESVMLLGSWSIVASRSEPKDIDKRNEWKQARIIVIQAESSLCAAIGNAETLMLEDANAKGYRAGTDTLGLGTRTEQARIVLTASRWNKGKADCSVAWTR